MRILKVDPFDATSPAHLDSKLRAYDIFVPGRTRGRRPTIPRPGSPADFSRPSQKPICCIFLPESSPEIGPSGVFPTDQSNRTRSHRSHLDEPGTRRRPGRAGRLFRFLVHPVLPGLRPAAFPGYNHGACSRASSNTPAHVRLGGTRRSGGHAAHRRSRVRRMPQTGHCSTFNQLARRIRQLAARFRV